MRREENLDFLFYFKCLAAIGIGGYVLYVAYKKMLPLPRQIQNERDSIARDGKRLGSLKDHAITSNTPLSRDYAIQLLKLINKIVTHDITHRNHYGQERARRRRANLGNLAVTAKLFRDSANLIIYHPEQNYNAPHALQGYIGTNIFNNLAFLYLFDICQYTTPLATPLYQMTDQEVATILNEICPVLQTIAEQEIHEYESHFHGVLSIRHNFNVASNRLHGLVAMPPNLIAIRNQYSDPRSLPRLFTLVCYHRETTHIHNAIQAIQLCAGLQFGAPFTAAQYPDKRALLRSLTIIGEAFTQTNLTPQSRSLSTLSQRDYSLFKKIRDRIADSQFDIHRNNAENYVQLLNNNFATIQAELNTLLPELQNILQGLTQLQLYNQLAAHYANNGLAPQAQYLLPGMHNHQERFPEARAFLVIFPNNMNNAYRQDKQNHPVNFTPFAIAAKINNELQKIAAIVANIPGNATLSDPHEENKHIILNQGNPTLIQLLQQANLIRNNNALTQAIQIIQLLNPNHNGVLIIEIAAGVIAPPFNPADHLNGMPINITLQFVNNNFDNLSASLEQYARKLQFVNFLSGNQNVKLTFEYHLGKLIRILNEIPRRQLISLMRGLPEAEVRAFRNAIQHNSNDGDLVGIPMESFICHYLAPILTVLPGLLAPLNQHGPHLPRQSTNFTYKQLMGIGFFGTAVLGAGYYFREELGIVSTPILRN